MKRGALSFKNMKNDAYLNAISAESKAIHL